FLRKAFLKRRATRDKEREHASNGNRAIERTSGRDSPVGWTTHPWYRARGKHHAQPPKGNAAFVHDLLLFLEDKGFPFAPRFFGRDERGRDILSYPDGAIWPDSGSKLPDALLEQAARAIGRYHDVTAGSSGKCPTK